MKAELGNTPADKDYKPSGVNAPVKIYMQPNESGESVYLWDTKRLIGENIEYIRKDALVEWLKGFNHPTTKLIVKDIIDHINSL